MKKLIYLCLFLSFSNVSIAQVPDTAPWCPDGATWVYQRKAMSETIFSVYEFIKDTTIGGLQTKIIKSKEIYVHYPDPTWDELVRTVQDSSLFYLHERNDSLFYFFNDELRFMYDFNADVNDRFISKSFNEYLPCDNSNLDYLENDTLEVFLKNTVNSFGGSNLVFDRLIINSKGKWDYGNIIKHIGGDKSFFPRPSNDSICKWINTHSLLSCYSDNTRGSFSFIYTNDFQNQIEQCEYIVTKVNEIEFVKDEYFLYPNPSNNVISVYTRNSTNISDVYIIDLTGKIIKSIQNTNLKVIDITNIPKRYYLCIIQYKSLSLKTL